MNTIPGYVFIKIYINYKEGLPGALLFIGGEKMWINNPCAYCRYHRNLMSVKMVKKKKCIERKCRHLVKKDHGFWNSKKKFTHNVAKRKNKNYIYNSFLKRLTC